MIGTASDPGIMVRVMDDLFIHSESQGPKDVMYRYVILVVCYVILHDVMLYYMMFNSVILHHIKPYHIICSK